MVQVQEHGCILIGVKLHHHHFQNDLTLFTYTYCESDVKVGCFVNLFTTVLCKSDCRTTCGRFMLIFCPFTYIYVYFIIVWIRQTRYKI